jgi:hypothetical protein
MFRAEALTIQFVDESEISPVRISPDYTVMLKLFENAVKGDITHPISSDEVGGETGPGRAANEGKEPKKVQEMDRSKDVKKADKPRKTHEKPAKKVMEEEKQSYDDDDDFQTGDGKEAKPGGLEFLTVASSDFLPPKDEVEIVGTDLLAGFTIYPLFPTTLR